MQEGADQHEGRRPSALPDESVPAVPAAAGPRMYVVLSALMGLLGVAFLALTVFSAAPLADLVGLADTSTATVTKREYRDVVPIGRGSKCDFYRFEVAWDDRTGYFTVCDNPALANARLVEGDQVVVTSVPWSSEVVPEGAEGALFWGAAGLGAGVFLVVLGAAWVRRYRRLQRGTATGVRLTGTVARRTRNAVHVSLSTPGLEGRRLVLLPAKRTPAVGERDRVDVWSSRRSLLTRRPAGPWVVKARRNVEAYTHAWFRGSREMGAQEDEPGR